MESGNQFGLVQQRRRRTRDWESIFYFMPDDPERDYALERQNNGLQGMQLAIEAPTPDQNAPTETNDATSGSATEEASSDSPASEDSPCVCSEDATATPPPTSQTLRTKQRSLVVTRKEHDCSLPNPYSSATICF
uniref:Uncharacterized protein n=1 Tax=Trichogramma kaykai TaxID=54128 RepID=A0ABD2W7T3_9HYME